MLNRGLISVSGPEVVKFLQALITNDIIACSQQQIQYSLLLNAQGRYLFDFFIYNIAPGEYILDTEYTRKGELLARLNMYKLRSAVEIKDASDYYSVSYARTKPELLAENVMLCARDCRYHKLGYRILWKGKLDDDGKSHALYQEDKYDYAIPDGAHDLEYAASLPPDYGADQLGATNYDKGCYVGQEVLARIKHQGVVRKAIYKVMAEDVLASLPYGSLIHAQDQKIGKLCSSYGKVGIALIKEQEFAEAVLCGISVRLHKAPWMH